MREKSLIGEGVGREGEAGGGLDEVMAAPSFTQDWRGPASWRDQRRRRKRPL